MLILGIKGLNVFFFLTSSKKTLGKYCILIKQKLKLSQIIISDFVLVMINW